MYPLVVILGIGMMIKNRQTWLFGLPLSSIGLLITIYHYQLQIFPNQNSFSSSTEVSCTGTWIMEFVS